MTIATQKEMTSPAPTRKVLPNWLKAFFGIQIGLAVTAVLVGLSGLRMKQVYDERDRLEASQKQFTSIQSQLDASNQRTVKLMIEQQKLQTEIDNNRNIVAASLLNNSEKEISRLSAQLKASQETIQGLQNRLKSSEQRVSSVEAQQHNFQTQLAANTNTIGLLAASPSAFRLAPGTAWLPVKHYFRIGDPRSTEFYINAFQDFNSSFNPINSSDFGVPSSFTMSGLSSRTFVPFELRSHTFVPFESLFYDPSFNQFSAYQHSPIPSLFGVRSTPKFNYTEFGMKISF